MRPKKRALLYCEEEQRASELAFVLNNGPDFKAAKCESVEQFRMMVHSPWELVVIVTGPSIERTGDICQRARRGTDCPVLVLRWPAGTVAPMSASLTLPPMVSMEGVLNTMKNLSRRHRGPKKDSRARPFQCQTKYSKGSHKWQ